MDGSSVLYNITMLDISIFDLIVNPQEGEELQHYNSFTTLTLFPSLNQPQQYNPVVWEGEWVTDVS